VLTLGPEDDLDDILELGQGRFPAHPDPPPDHGADLADPVMELKDGRIRLLVHDLE
jgi:hypothetical protein